MPSYSHNPDSRTDEAMDAEVVGSQTYSISPKGIAKTPEGKHRGDSAKPIKFIFGSIPAKSHRYRIIYIRIFFDAISLTQLNN